MFRQFARERRAKLLKTKMSRFLVKYQEGAHLKLENVTVRVLQGAAIVFYNSNGRGFYILEDVNIETFDDTIPAEVTLIISGRENVHLEFIDEARKDEFVAAVTAFLGHR